MQIEKNFTKVFIVFLIGLASCSGEVFGPCGHVNDLRALGIQIEKAERKADDIQCEIVLPARTTFKRPPHNVSNSFSSVTLIHNGKGPDPDPKRVRDKKTKGRHKAEKTESGNFRARILVSTTDAKNTWVDIRYEGDKGGNPLILGFPLLSIFEQVEKDVPKDGPGRPDPK